MNGAGRDVGGVLLAAVEGPAKRAGLRPGDRLLSVGETPVVDILDLEMAAADGVLDLLVEHEGVRRTVTVEIPPGGWHGLSLEHGLGSETRTCVNACRFCFVDQMPAGLRETLYVKDDDYRLSFLHGTFVTLSNLDEADLRRIERLALSPLYVSLHAWDDDVRARLMGPAASVARERLVRLDEAGICTHIQVVLCPGVNDGRVLEETVRRLAALEGVEDVGVVPVSLTEEHDLRRLRPADARATVALIDRLQRDLRHDLGRTFVHAADELYLAAAAVPPAPDAALQYENGIGLCAAFLADADDVADELRAAHAMDGGPGLCPSARGLRLLTGEQAAPVVAAACRGLPAARPLVVRNRLFGPHVTVTGLLGGREVLDALTVAPLDEGEWLLAPRSFLPAALGRTLDDVNEEELAAACGGRLVVAGSVADALRELMSPGDRRTSRDRS